MQEGGVGGNGCVIGENIPLFFIVIKRRAKQ